MSKDSPNGVKGMEDSREESIDSSEDENDVFSEVDDNELEEGGEEVTELRYERVGRDDVGTAIGKIKDARRGESYAQDEVMDLTRRWQVLKSYRPDIKNAIVETTLPFSLLVYSVLIAVVLFVVNEGSTAELYLTQTNRIGDLFLLNIGIILLLVAILLLGSRISKYFELRPASRTRAFVRGLVILVQLVPVALMTMFLAASVTGDGLVRAAFVVFYDLVYILQPIVPSFLSELGSTYFEISPLGFSVSDLIVVMVGAGILLLIPYVLKIFKAIVYIVASDSEQFPDVEIDPEELYEEPNPMDSVEWVSERDDGEIAFEIDEVAVEELLSIPDSMRMNPYERYNEVHRYWIRAPYSYVSILKNEQQSDYRYFLMEPQLKEGEEQLLLEEFNDRLGTTLLLKDLDDDFEQGAENSEKVTVIEDEVLHLANEYNISVEEETFHKLLYYIERDYVYYGKVDPLIRDPNVEDISCDGDNVPLFVFHRHYNDLMTNIAFDKEPLRQFIIELAQRSGEHISSASPLLDASLPNGSRIQMSLGSEITTHGSTFTIRLFQDTPFTPIDLINTGTFSTLQIAYLWQAIQYDKSLIFAGGTASGKTTSMNAVSLFIPPKSKVVTIEDTREIELPHMNWVPGVTREGFGGAGDDGGAGEIDMYQLLVSALRQRPEYMIVGEIRGDEANALFQAMSTGHTTYSTMHADSAKRAINRLTNPPINVPIDMISSLDIICIQNQVRVQDDETGDVKNVRRNEETVEIVDISSENRTTNVPFTRDAEMDEFRNNIKDSRVLDDIRKEQGWTTEDAREDLNARKKILEYMVENEIEDVEEVTQTIQAYMLNPKKVKSEAESGNLNPSNYQDITNVKFREPEETIQDDYMVEDIEAARTIPTKSHSDEDDKTW